MRIYDKNRNYKIDAFLQIILFQIQKTGLLINLKTKIMNEKLILTLICLSFSLSNFAQDNVAKIGLFGLATKTINLKYERVLNEKSSANLNLSFRIPGGLPLGLTVNDLVDGEITGDVRLNGINIAPEYRMYTKGDAPRGFYFAPYLQYSSTALTYAGKLDGFDTDSKLSYSNFGVGIQLGAQWLIQDKVSIDWTFFGLGVGSHRVKARYESDDPNINFQDILTDIETDVDDIPIVGDRFEFEAGADYGEGKTNFIFPLLRSGLTIGFAF